MTNQEKIEYLNTLGFQVISENLTTNLIVKCSKEHVFKREFYDFQKGYTACPICEIEHKITFLNSLGFEPISENLGKKLKVKCQKGHIFKRTFGSFKDGISSCPECEKKEKYDFLKELGFEIMSNNLGTNLEVKCEKGHIFKRPYKSFKNGHINCPICEINNKHSFINNLGFEILSNNLTNDLEIKCRKGHIFKRTFNSFKNGQQFCPICEAENKHAYLNSLGFTIMSDNLADNLEVKCQQGHVFKRTFGNFSKGHHLCPFCYPNYSTFEQEVRELTGGTNNWEILNGKELDIYLPEYNLAIECNGDFWHSESMNKDKKYHLTKTEQCVEKNIQLIHIFESSWNEKKNIWTSIINNKLGKSDKIMARKCILKEVSKTEEKEFLNKNHLQGFTGSSICYGLYYQDELVCLMSFGKPRFTGKYDWELIRLCTKIGMNVVGGSSKLLNHFHKNNKGSLISYSDRLYSNGSIYKQLGFTFSHYSEPGYYYFKNNTRYSRQQFMKHKLKDKLEKFDPNKTEYENMVENGYYRIWDCGQGVWVKESLSKNII
ncbi:putative homing endonuclease [Campylobacter phage F367]|uniref:Putative homing endonuclease n=2 Tax=Fletchervirus CPX TaxID=1110702 RepID=A0A7T3N566_9CAUD|nr:putative homing endonuclease [Campylobacter phage F367]QPX64894.1 putative homing endonuclease [Campylobacter phage F368]